MAPDASTKLTTLPSITQGIGAGRSVAQGSRVKQIVGHIGIVVAAGAAAGMLHAGIAAREKPAPDEAAAVVVTLPQRAVPPAIAPRPQPASPRPDGQGAIVRQIQGELRRVGCYDGDINGVWTTSTRFAMQVFIERVNARLPIDKPDAAHLALVQGQQEKVCGAAPCPAADARRADARCKPDATLAKAADRPEPSEAAPTRTPAPPASAAPAVAAVAPRLIAPPTEAVRPREPARADPPPPAPKGYAPPPPAATRAPDTPAASDPADPQQRSARERGPTPSVGVYEGRPKRTWRRVQARQMAYARSVLRTFKRAVTSALPLP